MAKRRYEFSIEQIELKRYYVHWKTMKTINMSSFPPCCYYCDSKDFGSVDGYERHIVTRHPNLPGYPEPADIK